MCFFGTEEKCRCWPERLIKSYLTAVITWNNRVKETTCRLSNQACKNRNRVQQWLHTLVRDWPLSDDPLSNASSTSTELLLLRRAWKYFHDIWTQSNPSRDGPSLHSNLLDGCQQLHNIYCFGLKPTQTVDYGESVHHGDIRGWGMGRSSWNELVSHI